MKFSHLKDIANRVPTPNSFKHYHRVAEDGRIVKGVNTTADVDVNSISKEAGKFGNKVDKDGRPPTLSKKVKGPSTNVAFNLGMTETINEAQELGSASEIYVDMDGVLVDFFGEWTKMMGVDNWKQIKNVDSALQKIRDDDQFWLKLKPTANAGKLLGIIKRIKGEYNILSAPLAGDPKAEPHKREWIAKYLKVFPPKKVIITVDKQKYAKQPDGTPNILIDDFGQNVAKWEAAGGVGFKHKDHKFERTAQQLADYLDPKQSEAIAEILGFATKRPKTNTVKRRPPEPEEDSVQDKIKQRRALARKIGTDKAFKHDAIKREGELIPNPKNTSLVKSDSDYDFMKLGTNMANIKDIDPSDMNPNDPDIMVQFYGGDKEKVYMLKQLKRLGYDVQDADGYKDAQYDEVISDDPNAYRLIINLIPENFADGKKKG